MPVRNRIVRRTSRVDAGISPAQDLCPRLRQSGSIKPRFAPLPLTAMRNVEKPKPRS
jgi:hypothetical protein